MISKLIKLEFYQISKSRLFLIMLIICCLMSFFFTSNDFLIEPIVQNTPNNVLGIYMNGLADVGVALLVITGCYSAYLMGEQFKQRTINLKILSGYSKTQLYIVQAVKTFCIVGFLISISSVVGCLKYGIMYFLRIMSMNIGYFTRSLIFIFFLAFAITSFSLIFAVIFQDTTKTLIISFIFLFLSCYIMAAIVANFLTKNNLSSAYDVNASVIMKFYPPYLWRWVLNPNLKFNQLLSALAIALGWGAIGIGIGCYIFEKKEIK